MDRTNSNRTMDNYKTRPTCNLRQAERKTSTKVVEIKRSSEKYEKNDENIASGKLLGGAECEASEQ